MRSAHSWRDAWGWGCPGPGLSPAMWSPNRSSTGAELPQGAGTVSWPHMVGLLLSVSGSQRAAIRVSSWGETSCSSAVCTHRVSAGLTLSLVPTPMGQPWDTDGQLGWAGDEAVPATRAAVAWLRSLSKHMHACTSFLHRNPIRDETVPKRHPNTSPAPNQMSSN